MTRELTAFSAPTLIDHIRATLISLPNFLQDKGDDILVEHKTGTEPVIPPVHRAPYDAEKRLRVDQDPHAVLLYHFIESASGRWDVIEMIRHSCASAGLDAYP